MIGVLPQNGWLLPSPSPWCALVLPRCCHAKCCITSGLAILYHFGSTVGAGFAQGYCPKIQVLHFTTLRRYTRGHHSNTFVMSSLTVGNEGVGSVWY